jgi:hypothetical protein
MGILTDLLLDDAPAIAPGPTHDTPREERPTRSIGIDIPGAIEIADGLVRFLRSPAIPRSTVERLEWGADGVPPYVEQLDETYSVGVLKPHREERFPQGQLPDLGFHIGRGFGRRVARHRMTVTSDTDRQRLPLAAAIHVEIAEREVDRPTGLFQWIAPIGQSLSEPGDERGIAEQGCLAARIRSRYKEQALFGQGDRVR